MNIDTVKKALARLDFTAENESIASHRSEIARLQEAIQRAEARCTVIARMLIKQESPKGTEVADALLQEAKPSEAARLAPDREALQAERDALRAGIRELRERIQDTEVVIADIIMSARRQALDATQPLIDALQTEMQNAARRLLSGFAAIDALGYGFGFSTHRGPAENAAKGLMGQGCLLSYRRQLPVPSEICELLESVRSKGEALPVRIIREVQML